MNRVCCNRFFFSNIIQCQKKFQNIKISLNDLEENKYKEFNDLFEKSVKIIKEVTFQIID